MIASELIKKLQELIESNGDLEVCYSGEIPDQNKVNHVNIDWDSSLEGTDEEGDIILLS